MRIVFMGSADLACPCLRRVLAEPRDTVCAVVTQPDRPKGRRLQLAGSPVKACAAAAGCRILTPEKVNTPDSVEAIRLLQPELIVVVAYGQILRPALLAVPAGGCVNVHTSLLPRYRGAAPIQWAIARGETVTGVTTMYMNERMDEGDIIFQSEVAIDPADTGGSLHDKLAAAGARLLGETLDALRAGTAPRRPQDERGASFAPKLSKQDGRIDWSRAAVELRNRVRGFTPWPGSFCEVTEESVAGRLGQRAPHAGAPRRCVLKVLEVRVEPGAGAPGEVLEVGAEGPLVATGEAALRLVAVQPEGGRLMSGAAYVCGHPLHPGSFLL